MADAGSSANLLRLMSWLSPAFPVGAFAYSHGVEQAIHDGLVSNRQTLQAWLIDLIERGSCWNDAVLFAETWRLATAGDDCSAVAELADAMSGSGERLMESSLQGDAFAKAVMAWGDPPAHMATTYPVAVAIAAANHAIPVQDALTAYLHAFTSNLIQAAVRLVPLGQSEGVAVLAMLEPTILKAADRASRSTLDDLGSATVISDVMSMKHETLYSRIFRS